jgi:hypothetical protein
MKYQFRLKLSFQEGRTGRCATTHGKLCHFRYVMDKDIRLHRRYINASQRGIVGGVLNIKAAENNRVAIPVISAMVSMPLNPRNVLLCSGRRRWADGGGAGTMPQRTSTDCEAPHS